MKLKSISGYSWLVGTFFGCIVLVLGLQVFFATILDVAGVWITFGGIFSFDYISFYLLILSILLAVSLIFWSGFMSGFGIFFIGSSLVCSILCYCSVHILWFWIFYEMSIIFLFLLLVLESPYSERYVATWYLLGYIVLTSLPMLLCFLFFGVMLGSFDIRSLGLVSLLEDSGMYGICLCVLSVLFMTKIPLPPFHVWLPIVHAEASSPVSVCLSGYIMKLGILGVCRFCSYVLPEDVFSSFYILVCFFVASLFFLAATRELDGKRWLAFLSLSHIMVACAILSLGGWSISSVSFLYCLGHGLSAGVIFLFLWFIYECVSTRNLVLLKSGVCSSLFVRVLACSCICTSCSLPPTVQFFSEVALVSESGRLSVFFIILLYLFLFAGGLVPLFLIGFIITRHVDVVVGLGGGMSCLVSLLLLVFWGFSLFLIC